MPYTLTGLASYQEEIKKSRFTVFAAAAQSPAQALQFVAAHRVAEATHNCWAYRIGSEYRFSDDGEPGGTAGRPILKAIEGQQYDRVAVLVVRWFGGIKLGPGGLIRAYGGTAAQCLRLADKTELIDEVMVACRCGFADMAVVQSRFPAFSTRIVEETFDGEGVRWTIAFPRTQEEALAQLFVNLTRGQGSWSPV
ncbi:thymidylate synthase [Pollutimonas nitritireducens]|uniref:Thymidylate synthase n=1 Tax=Pollutimonas nitritireducens TaxID=2045209 RepID=A0A2N4UGF5_9BURK|nr:YigZ family protein [Pollutimonas nitritireducens]PLC54096.1 thymidylate synthase [Pollutimonas nitritireducens]